MKTALKGAALRLLNLSAQGFGIDPVRLARTTLALPRYVRGALRYARSDGGRGGEFPMTLRGLTPMLADAGESAGVAGGHYFHQDLWAARKIYQRRPARHLDVGSRVDGFVAHVLTFMPVTLIDVRALETGIDGLSMVQQDATHLSGIASDSVESLSSLHAVEHFGLGRYGDPIAPNACFDAMRAFARVLRPDGRLYFSVPIGRQRLEFNAQRVFAPETVLRGFRGLSLVSFSAVDDRGDLVSDTQPERFADASYACGLFEFTKREPSSARGA